MLKHFRGSRYVSCPPPGTVHVPPSNSPFLFLLSIYGTGPNGPNSPQFGGESNKANGTSQAGDYAAASWRRVVSEGANSWQLAFEGNRSWLSRFARGSCDLVRSGNATAQNRSTIGRDATAILDLRQNLQARRVRSPHCWASQCETQVGATPGDHDQGCDPRAGEPRQGRVADHKQLGSDCQNPRICTCAATNGLGRPPRSNLSIGGGADRS
jgi:hypothetical protein